MLGILLLAAGKSSRMRGQDKLMQTVQGTPLIAHMARRALATGCPVIVCLPGNPGARAAALNGMGLHLLPVADADLGMSHTIRAGIAALPPQCTGAMILPADMPDLTETDLSTMIDAHDTHPDAILRGASADTRAGHPVVFPRATFSAFDGLSGDTGARAVIAAFPGRLRIVALPGLHAITDLDTPEDWAAWRARQG